MSARSDRPLRYADTGVDIDAADATVDRYRELARRTRRPEVLGGVGPFAGLFQLDTSAHVDPVLVGSADGVGTKMLIASAMGRYDTVGHDLVNHCVNDILTTGAEPLFFLDYLATADLSQDRRVEIVAGIGAACEANGCALLGGETADMPDLYASGDYDLAGFIVGVVSRERVLDGSKIRAGDALIALPSTGLHTNGYSLVREAFGVGKGVGPDHDRDVLDREYEELGSTLGEALLAVHASYLDEVRPVLDRVHGIAHITGGGIPGNLPRVLPDGLGAMIDRASWRVPGIFDLIQTVGHVEDEEMMRTFNMGVGIILAVASEDAPGLLRELAGSWRLGEVVERAEGAPSIETNEGASTDRRG